MCILMKGLQQYDLPVQIINLKWNQLHTFLPLQMAPKAIMYSLLQECCADKEAK